MRKTWWEDLQSHVRLICLRAFTSASAKFSQILTQSLLLLLLLLLF